MRFFMYKGLSVFVVFDNVTGCDTFILVSPMLLQFENVILSIVKQEEGKSK